MNLPWRCFGVPSPFETSARPSRGTDVVREDFRWLQKVKLFRPWSLRPATVLREKPALLRYVSEGRADPGARLPLLRGGRLLEERVRFQHLSLVYRTQ
jgi:hypothetical protein